MENLIEFLHAFSSVLWSPVTLGFILLTGLILTIQTKWLAITKIKLIWEHTFGSMNKKGSGEGEISPFQALATAISACLGVGTIVGVATAIATGGPGAVFWMWFAGFLSIATKFSELTLAVHFRVKNNVGEWVGGPMYYASRGLKGRFGKILAMIFSVSVAIAAIGIGNMVQANAVAGALESAFGFTGQRLWIGIVFAVLVAASTLGGVKRIAAVAEKTFPISTGIVMIISIIGIIVNIDVVPQAFVYIFRGAFTPQAAGGGFLGAGVATAMRLGIARGLFSNEGGLGSAPIAHASATTDHPVKQGLWGAAEVFIDTHVVCTLVALVIITSGAWMYTDASCYGLTASPLVLAAYDSVIPFGGMLMAVGITLFGVTTMIGWGIYGEKGLEYLFGPKTNLLYRLIWLPPIVIGASGNVALVWAFADVFNSFMLIPNLITLLALSGLISRLLSDFLDGKPYTSYYDSEEGQKDTGGII